ncbi:MAG: hypothetical protein HND57_09010 [Planctomycetes bacterium]|nr:hypothetical protein [Planctomycetota bacterium]
MSRVRHRVSRAANQISNGRLHRHATRKKPAIVARTVWCPRWPQALDGFTILHISDFHLGELLTPDQALGMVADAQEQAGPVDLLAMTGDLIDFDDFSGARTLLARLAAYPARYGAWAVTGNHDVLVDPDAFSRLYDGVGIHLLDNQSHAVCPAGRPEITVSGIEWGKSRRPALAFGSARVRDTVQCHVTRQTC